jgi:hypothetical protein
MSWFTDLSIGRIFNYNSPLPSEALIQKLKTKTGEPKWTEADDPTRLFIGRITGNKFRLRRQMYIRKAFTPVFYGKITDSDSGSCLTARIVIHPVILIILSIWFLFFFSIALLFIYYSGMDEAVDWLMVFPLLFMFLILLLFLIMAKSEIDSLHSDLDSLLTAE